MKRSRWLLLTLSAVLLLGVLAAAPASAAKSVTFVTQPAATLMGQTITSVSLDQVDGTVDGPFVQVQAVPNSTVNLTSNPAGLNASAISDGSGIATFTGISGISLATPGEYTLTASSSQWGPATSSSFLVLETAAACSGNSKCDTTVGTLAGPTGETARIVGTPEGSGVVGAAKDIESLGTCPGDSDTQFNHGPSVISAFWENMDGEVIITLTISKAWDQTQPQNGASFYQVCFTYDLILENGQPKTFEDKFGETVVTGLLPDCGRPDQGPACVKSRTKDKKGNVLIVIRALEDPLCR
jgi:hypothetical protein